MAVLYLLPIGPELPKGTTSQSCAPAGAHELKERTRVPLQTNLIAYSSHAHEVKEWYYYPEPSAESKAAGGRAEHADGNRAGPISKDELKMRYAQEKVRGTCSCNRLS